MTLKTAIKASVPNVALVAIGAFFTAYAGGGGELFLSSLVVTLVALVSIPLIIHQTNSTK